MIVSGRLTLALVSSRIGERMPRISLRRRSNTRMTGCQHGQEKLMKPLTTELESLVSETDLLIEYLLALDLARIKDCSSVSLVKFVLQLRTLLERSLLAHSIQLHAIKLLSSSLQQKVEKVTSTTSPSDQRS